MLIVSIEVETIEVEVTQKKSSSSEEEEGDEAVVVTKSDAKPSLFVDFLFKWNDFFKFVMMNGKQGSAGNKLRETILGYIFDHFAYDEKTRRELRENKDKSYFSEPHHFSYFALEALTLPSREKYQVQDWYSGQKLSNLVSRLVLIGLKFDPETYHELEKNIKKLLKRVPTKQCASSSPLSDDETQTAKEDREKRDEQEQNIAVLKRTYLFDSMLLRIEKMSLKELRDHKVSFSVVDKSIENAEAAFRRVSKAKMGGSIVGEKCLKGLFDGIIEKDDIELWTKNFDDAKNTADFIK